MKNLLLNNFLILHHKSVGSIPINEKFISGAVSLHDDIACRSCIPFFANSCEQEVLNLYSQDAVVLINIEEYLDNLKTTGRRCDYLLYDENKIMLADLTCSMEEYLHPHLMLGVMQQGKRLTARQQIEHTLELLAEEPEIVEYIDNKSSKIGLLAYRIKDEDLFADIPKQLQELMTAWLAMENDLEMRKLRFPMSHGFSFEMIKYPNVYQW